MFIDSKLYNHWNLLNSIFRMLVSYQNCKSAITQKRINISVSNAPKGDQIWLIHPAYFSTDYFTCNFITSNMTWLK